MKMRLLLAVAAITATQAAFGDVVCTITDQNRIPVWAHKVTRSENPNKQGMYIEVSGPTKVIKDKAGRIIDEIENYGTRLSYKRTGRMATFCSLDDAELKTPENRAMLTFAVQNSYNSSRPSSITAAIKSKIALQDFNDYIQAFTNKASAMINSASQAVGNKLQPLGDKADAQISRVTNSAAAQRLQSSMNSAANRVDALGKKIAKQSSDAIESTAQTATKKLRSFQA